MTLQEFESKLSAKELQEFKENVMNMGYLVIPPYKSGYEWVIDSSDDFMDIVNGAFTWSRTPQGQNYWYKISQR